ncbi:MAG: ATP-binding cassette domain-containing protein [Myxococcales bacterium]|nr:ATP-binding cassette domain-containing protein [Myxococcales bacterium]
MIELIEVTKTYIGPNQTNIRAVDSVSLQVEDGQTLCLIGTSGSGKTTAMKLVNRLIEPTSGTIRVNGRDVREHDLIQLRRQIGYVLQFGGLFPHQTVAENIGLLCQMDGWTKQQTLERVRSLLHMVNLPYESYGSRYPVELSGGQRQRVGVARALSLDPQYLLMDEPFGALDPITRHQLHDEFLEIKQKVQKTTILVTHDIKEAFILGDLIGVMDQGRLVQIGSTEDIQASTDPFIQSLLHNV